jgi:hypothetical protein
MSPCPHTLVDEGGVVVRVGPDAAKQLQVLPRLFMWRRFMIGLALRSFCQNRWMGCTASLESLSNGGVKATGGVGIRLLVLTNYHNLAHD